MRKTELAWAAGLFDGEGSTGVFRDRYLRLSMSMTDRCVLERFISAIDHGKVAGPYRRADSPNRKDMWRWSATGTPAEGVLERLWPFLSRPKQEQAERARTRMERP